MIAESPLVSIYVITYNRVELLQRCIESLLVQTYQNIEIIVVDDCSSDGTSQYLKEISRKEKKIRFFLNDSNSGACYSRNKAIDAALGEFITGVDDDDYFLETRIEDFVKNSYLLNKYSLLYTDSIWKTKSGFNKPIINKFFRNPIKAKDLLFFNFIGNQVFMKTSILKKYKFDLDFPAWQDLECWYNILSKTKTEAFKVKIYSYVQDVSHEHERISSGKKEKILEAFDKLSGKHDLSALKKILLRNHFFNYGIKSGFFLTPVIMAILCGGFKGILVSMRNTRDFIKSVNDE